MFGKNRANRSKFRFALFYYFEIKMKYKTEKEIFEVVEKFENGTISRENWRHAEHLTVALFYFWHHDFEISLVKMRDGIFNLLKAFEVDLKVEMPYHETLTVFWLKTVKDFTNAKKDCSMVEVCNELIGTFDKDYPLRFYKRELLFSERARIEFVEPN